MRKATLTVLAILVSIALFITVLFTCLEWVAFDENRYAAARQQFGVSVITGMSEDDMKVVMHELLEYCRGDRSNLNMRAAINSQMREVFDQREKDHMVDVQKLFVTGFKVRTYCIVAFLFLLLVMIYVGRKRTWYELARGWVIAIIVLGSLLVALGIYFAVDFDRAWTQFHLVFFSNDLWMLYDYEVLIQMLAPVFDGLVQAIMITAAVAMAVITAGAVIALRLGKKKYAKAEIEELKPEDLNDDTGD